MPLEGQFQPGSINQVGQGLRGPGERHGWSNTLSAHTAASIAFGTSGSIFPRSSYYFNQLNPLFYGPSPELRPQVPQPLQEQESFIQQVFGYRTPYWQGISGLHPGNKGYGTATVRNLTDFGSGFDRDKALNRAGSFFTNPLVTGLGATAVLGVPSFHDPVRVGFLGLQATALGYARGGPIGAAVGLGAFYALDKAGQAINRMANQGEQGKPTDWDVMRHFMLYGIVEGGLAAGTSAAFLQGSPIRPIAHEMVGLASGIKALVTGKPYLGSEPIEGLAPEFQGVASPLRRWYQGSIVHTAEFLNKRAGMSEDFAMKFSEAFHGESAYVMRQAQKFGGLKEIPHTDFYKALGKDITIGAAGGLVENALVGAAYLGLTHLLSKPARISGKDDDYNTIEGLHPGAYGSMGAGMIGGMTAFGSGLKIDKVLNWEAYSSRIAVEHRDYIKSVLAAVPGANIIGFDIESTGLISPLESITQGQAVGRMTEFAIGGGGQATLHGFTQQANMVDYTNLYLEGGAFAKEFHAASRRYASYTGKAFKASDVVNEIVSRIQPGKTNILTGHNIHAFDIKFLSAELAMEKGYVTPEHIETLASLVPRTKEHNIARSIVQEGWERASKDIRKAIMAKDANLMVVDTLGGFKKGEFPRTFESMQGVASSFLGGFLGPVSKFWESHFKGLGLEKEELASAVKFASHKGTALSPFMEHFGIKFLGAEHDPVSDVEQSIRFLASPELTSRVSQLSSALEGGRKSTLSREAETFIKRQISLQEETLNNPSSTEGARKLADRMVKAAGGEKVTLPKATLREAFQGLSFKQKAATGAVGLGLAYAAYRSFFATSKTIHVDSSTNDDNPRPDNYNVKRMHTVGLVNHVLHGNAIKHSSYQGKSM